MEGGALWFQGMCRLERTAGSNHLGGRQISAKPEGGGGGVSRAEKLKSSMVSRPKIKIWMVRVTTMVLLLMCVLQLMAIGEIWGPRILRGWQLVNESSPVVVVVVDKILLPPKRIYKNNGYLMVSCNGGLNQMRGAICDMVAIARYLNVTLIVQQELDKTSFWNDPSEFEDIFDVDHFITSLKDEVGILKELPQRLKGGLIYSTPPVSWSDISYYENQILPLIQKHKVIHLNRTDARLANNGLPLEIQKIALQSEPCLS